MNSCQLLEDLRQRGVELTAIDGRLRVCAPVGTVTVQMREALRLHKPALLAALRKSDPKFQFVDGPMDFGDVCHGWTPEAWALELRRKAGRCDEYRPDISVYYRDWAAHIEKRLPPDVPGGMTCNDTEIDG